ncbi:MAG: zinc ribbon domain-containing protein [Tindallia sp. MSAO_Bac2]|nr:MAG: zinc ribbon domain-containing protein [Tindallia sp. MSAO_Bac2]
MKTRMKTDDPAGLGIGCLFQAVGFIIIFYGIINFSLRTMTIGFFVVMLSIPFINLVPDKENSTHPNDKEMEYKQEATIRKYNSNGGHNTSHTSKLISCPGCGKDVSPNAKFCPNCGEPIDTSVKCPKCGSKDTKVISGGGKAVSLAIWGPFAANKVLSKNECKSCSHKF